jgi:hypothetical protein
MASLDMSYGVIINSIGLLKCIGPGSHVFCDEFAVDLDPPEVSNFDIISCQSGGRFGFSIDNFVTICANKAATDDDMVDVEFQDTVQAMCWDQNGQALLATDASGTLHFVNVAGTILFSRKLIPGMIMLLSTSHNFISIDRKFRC